MPKGKPNLSLRIDENLKKEFVTETYYNDTNMTEVIEGFVKVYVQASKNAKGE
jgi:hypothetical protein